MVRFGLSLNLIAVITFGLLTAAQCQPTPISEPPDQLTPQPNSSPTPLLFPPVQPGDGSDLIDHLLKNGVIRVGIHVWPEASYSPPAFRGFSNAVTGGALNGFEVELAHQLADGLGLELELVEAYPPVIASGDWRGEWDIAVASLVPFDQTQPALFFSRPYGYMPLGLLVPVEENNIRSLNNLSGRKVGVLEHSPYQRLLTEGPALTVNQQPVLFELPSNIQVIPVSNLAKAIRQLAQLEEQEAAQIDAIVGPAPVFQEAIKSEIPVKLAAGSDNLGRLPLAVATVPQDGLKVDRLILEINRILDRLGTLAEIYLNWYGQDLSQDNPLPPTGEEKNKPE